MVLNVCYSAKQINDDISNLQLDLLEEEGKMLEDENLFCNEESYISNSQITAEYDLEKPDSVKKAKTVSENPNWNEKVEAQLKKPDEV